MPLLTEAIGSILDNFSDAVEGGNAYRSSGDKYWGIPSLRSHDDRLFTGKTSTFGTKTTVAIPTVTAADGARLVREDAAPFFLLCTAQASGTGNTGAARKITTHTVATFVVETDFAETVANGDTFSALEGFKRMQDITDHEAEDTAEVGGHDRAFSFDMHPGRQLDRGGDGTETWESELRMKLRILKKGREQTARKSALENAQNIASILTGVTARGEGALDLRGDYTESLTAMDREPTIEQDSTKVVATVRFKITYRFDAVYR